MRNNVFDKGVVTRIESDKAFVAIPENEACDTCGAKMICTPQHGKERGVMARNTANAEMGQEVLVTESEDMILKFSLMQYGVPLLGFLLGIFLLYSIPVSVPGIPEELLLFLGGIAGLSLGGIGTWIWSRDTASQETMYFEISKIYHGNNSWKNYTDAPF